jgi:hypothetical protein
MNVKTAREILDLPEKYNEKTLKQKYKSLAMRYHPDKNPDRPEQFIEINAAYQFLLNKNTQSDKNSGPEIENVINSIFKQFTGSFKFNRPCTRPVKRSNDLTLNLSGSDYFLGTTRSVPIQENCKCEPQICNSCGGSGFNLNLIEKHKPMGVCMKCLGEGNSQNCARCKNGTIKRNIDLTVRAFTPLEIFDPLIGLINLTLTLPYFVKDSQVFCKFDITLKESLTGFNKIFKDPFGTEHNIIVKNIVNSNDGYQLTGIKLILAFNVVYPKTINPEVVEQLKQLNF